jgi:hypothetical protein
MSADIIPFGTPREEPVKPRMARQHDPADREIARLREIAAQTGDALLLPHGPISPDARLLELCDEALYHLAIAEKLRARSFAMHDGESWTDESERLWSVFPRNATVRVKSLSRCCRASESCAPRLVPASWRRPLWCGRR